MDLQTVLKINVALFSLIGLIHLSRLLWQWEVSFAGWDVPLWLNGLFFILAGLLVWVNAKQLKKE